MVGFMCGGSSFHPYECSHDRFCEHCTNAETDWHKPSECWLCCDGDPKESEPQQFVTEPFAVRVRVTDLSHRKQKIKLEKWLTTITSKPQKELPF